tara:strand:- start:101 stop:820 length:720 start_codon:yes stop_codon:yes gene_type:complete
MTRLLFLEDSYMKEAPAVVSSRTDEGGIVLNQSLFYATSGGQPGDSGFLLWSGGKTKIETTFKGKNGELICMPGESEVCPDVGVDVVQVLDWYRRYRHMRMHTALHLLSVVVPLPVTGGAITAKKSRLDFDMPEAPDDKEVISNNLNTVISHGLSISETWITEEELDASPSLVKTLSVKPPKGAGMVRLVRIGQAENQIDLQPCGGTHVLNTSEIGRVRISKIEKKGRQNRRLHLILEQ